MHSFEGYPPIELYKIGEVYFVRDGNHRVSVARANGLNFIEAYVTELATDVDLTPGRLRARPLDHQGRAHRVRAGDSA
jgi:hypothetical protein